MAWLPNSSQLLTGSVDESVKLWSLSESSLEPAHAYTGHALGVISLEVEPSGAYAVTSSLDSMVRVFGIEDKTTKHMLERPPTETWQTVFGAVSPESTQLAVAGGSKGQVYTYRGSSEEPGLELTLDLPQAEGTGSKKERFVLSVAFSQDKQLLAAGAMDGTVAVWDMAAGGQLLHMAGLKGHQKPVRSLAFTPDSKMLLTGCDDMHSNLYDVHSGGLIDSFAGHESWVLDVAVHPEGAVFATSSSDAKVKLWELSSRSLVQTMTEHSDQVWGCAFSADGKRLASVSDDKQLVVYSVA